MAPLVLKVSLKRTVEPRRCRSGPQPFEPVNEPMQKEPGDSCKGALSGGQKRKLSLCPGHSLTGAAGLRQ